MKVDADTTVVSRDCSQARDSKLYMGTHNIRANLHQSMVQQPTAPRINSIRSDAICYQARDCRDLQMQTQIPDSSGS
ncbi:hypothetical protein LOK49_LG12G01938 [Camellia lanceoleosa]|uniref:Uncharacterized protein n=1 Tax=Camellia lanceoleosa TaxID=1840588 RepID=A0ACC0FRC9_9ERIC|nr:hypothetical protein LOK49_LG12G01938 [Camellia lanceoleosa]